LKINDMRWGLDVRGTGMCVCLERSFVELVVNDDGKIRFVLITGLPECCDIVQSSVSLYDFSVHLMDEDVDFESELQRMESLSDEHYCFSWDDEPSAEFLKSRFRNAFNIGLIAMKHYMTTPVDEEISADYFVKDYLGKDLDKITLPDLDLRLYDDEE